MLQHTLILSVFYPKTADTPESKMAEGLQKQAAVQEAVPPPVKRPITFSAVDGERKFLISKREKSRREPMK